MVAALDDDAVVEDDDLVGVDDRRQAVGDDQGRAVARDPVERRLDLALGMDVEGRGRLVEDQDRRRLEDGAGDGDALLLAAGELQAALADLGRVAVGQRFDEVADLGGGGGGARPPRRSPRAGRSGCCRRWCR